MPGPAPAKVQHLAIQLRVKTGQEITPVWDEEGQQWSMELTQTLDCTTDTHKALEAATEKCYCNCTEDNHTCKAKLVFRSKGRRHSGKRWLTKGYVSIDGQFEILIPVGVIMSLLSKPTNPQGEGKAAGESAGSNKQAMNVRRTTVIRV
jgi:hypothetical protein